MRPSHRNRSPILACRRRWWPIPSLRRPFFETPNLFPREFFPSKPEVAIAAGLLVVAPVLVEMHFVILNNMSYFVAFPMLGWCC